MPHRLRSSVLKTAAYDHDARILQLTFRTGKVYDYHDVPAFLFTELIRAASAGQFFNTHIKRQFQATLIRTELPRRSEFIPSD